MSYDLWLVPAEHCDSASAAREFAFTQDTADLPASAEATALAAAITAANASNDEESGFLSLIPLDATGSAVFVPSPFSQIQQARDVVVPQAFSARYGIYDPQCSIVLDPRTAVAGVTTTAAEGTFGTITPGLIDYFVRAMKIKEFVIIETGPETYMQSQRIDGGYVLEYRAGASDRHFGTDVETPDEVIDAMRGWLAGNNAAYQHHSWEKIDLG